MTGRLAVTLGKLIQERKKEGMNQVILAKRVGVDQSHISRIINGEKEASCETVVAIADVLGVSLDVLFGREKAKEEPPPPYIPPAVRSGRDPGSRYGCCSTVSARIA